MEDKYKSGLMTLFLGALGQFISRIVWLNGSLDKPWLFAFFPIPLVALRIMPIWPAGVIGMIICFVLTAIGSVWYFIDDVEMGEGADVVDANVYMLPLLGMAFTFIFTSLCDVSAALGYWLTTMTCVLFYAMARYMKRTNICEDDQRNFNEALWKSFIVNLVVPLANLVNEAFTHIPYINAPFTAWSLLDYIPGLQNGATLGLANLIENMLANTPERQKEYCENDTNMWTWYWWLLCCLACCVGSCVGSSRDFLSENFGV